MRIALIIIGMVVFIIAFALWSTITLELASNGKKTILTISMFRLFKREITLLKPETEESEPQNKESEEADEAETEEKGEEEPGGFSQDLKRMWNSEKNFPDFDGIKYVFEKYTGIIRDGKTALGRFFGHLKNKIRLNRLDLYIMFGLGEPDKTGMAYGGFYALAEMINPWIRQYFKTDRGIVLYLDPNYVNPCFGFEAGIKIKTRAAYIVNALIAALVPFIINYIKGSVKNVRIIRQASD